MRRYAIILLTMTGLGWGVAMAGAAAEPASTVAIIRAVSLSATPTGQELDVRVDGDYTYRCDQAAPDTLFIDLAGARVGGIPHKGAWSNPLLAGYKLLEYQDASNQPVVRLEASTLQAIPFTAQRDGAMLKVFFGVVPSASTAPTAAAAAPEPGPSGPALASAPAEHVASGPVRVSSLAVAKGDAGETFVDVSTSRAPEYHVSRLANPSRLVLDIEGAQVAARQGSYSVSSDFLRTVRLAQFRSEPPAVVRVVADLKGNPGFDVHATPTGLRLEFRVATASKSSPPAQTTAASSQPLVASVTVAPIAAAPAPVATPSITATDTTKAQEAPPVVPTVAEAKDASKPLESAPPAPAASATDELKKTAEPVESASAASTISTTPETQASTKIAEPVPVAPAVAAAPVVPEAIPAAKPDVQTALPPVPVSPQVAAAPLPIPAQETPETLRAQNAARILNPAREGIQAAQATPPANSTPATEDKPKYTGEPISLNLKDVDLKDFFRLIHEISGLNIIIDPNVNGSVTLVLDAVPWDQALDIVMKNNRLGKTLEGNVLRIARIETLTAEQESVSKLAAARIDAAPLVTVFQPLNYAKAVTVAALIKSWTGGGALSKRGTVLVDDRSNTLIISDVQSQIQIIQNIVAKMDKKSKQVLIEARVVLATADFTRNLAASLLPGYANSHTVATGATGPKSAITIPPPTQAQPFPITTVTPTNVTGFGVASVVNEGARYFIEAAITAAETRDQAKTISRPTIITQNNVQGMVQQGTQVPVQTTINNTITVNYVDATLRMDVTPQITDDGNVFMNIKVQNASVGALLVMAAPNINTQQATTQVLVPDGGTVVFGGITVTSRSKTATYVPWVGSIPILGNLFKQSQVQDNDLELLFFVSPKILTT